MNRKMLMLIFLTVASLSIQNTVKADSFARTFGANSYIYNMPLYYGAPTSKAAYSQKRCCKRGCRRVNKVMCSRCKPRTCRYHCLTGRVY